MRLDKYICNSTELTRSLAKKALHRGEVLVDGAIVKDSGFIVQQGMQVSFNGERLTLIGQRYVMLHKPVDTICSTIDEQYPSVINLVPIIKANHLHIAGRLDVDTTGLVLITDDGKWSHNVTAPKKKCSKRYRVWLADAVDATAVEQFKAGIALHNEDGLTQPAILELITSTEVLLTITEGKYHQVKRMFAAIGNKVVRLHREAIGGITLDLDLAPGEWRYLTKEEIETVT